MKRSTVMRTAAVGATCAIAGAAAGIAGSSASPSPSTTKDPVGHRWLKLAPLGAMAMAIPGDAAGPPVHSESVVPNDKGGFDAVTMDRGSFSSLSGEKLTITEGTKTSTYKTVTLTIPSGATVDRNGEKAQLSDIRTGDTVAVVQSPKGTFVDAFDAQHEPKIHVKGPPTGSDERRMLKPDEGPPAPGAPPGPGASSSAEASEGSSSSS